MALCMEHFSFGLPSTGPHQCENYVSCRAQKAKQWLNLDYRSPESVALTQQRHAAALSLHANMSGYDMFEPQLLREIIQLVDHEFMNPRPVGCQSGVRMQLQGDETADQKTERTHGQDTPCHVPTDNLRGPASLNSSSDLASLNSSCDQGASVDQKESRCGKISPTCVLIGTLRKQPSHLQSTHCRYRDQVSFVTTTGSGTKAEKETSFEDVLVDSDGFYSISANLVVNKPKYQLHLERYHPQDGRFVYEVLSIARDAPTQLELRWNGWLTKGDVLCLFGLSFDSTHSLEPTTTVGPEFKSGSWRIQHHCHITLPQLQV